MRFLSSLALAALVSTVSVPSLYAAPSSAELEAAVRKVLMEKPEIIVDALEHYQKQSEQRAKDAASVVAKEIAADKTVPSVGPADAKVTVVEFYDYNCGYCHKVAPDIAALIKDEKNVRWLFVDLPVLSPLSGEAAQMALAANNQGRYYDLHLALMQRRGGGPIDGKVVIETAEKLGLDTARLKKDAASPAAATALDKHREWAKKIGVNGTPSFIVGSEMVPGAVDKSELKALIEKAAK